MSELSEGVTMVGDLWDVLKALVSHSSLADEIKTAAHKVIDEDRAATTGEPSAQELAEREQLAQLQAKYGTGTGADPAAARPVNPAPPEQPEPSGVPVTPPREGM